MSQIIIVTALECEARPLIDAYKLKRNLSINNFIIYHNNNIILAIAGIGELAMANAIAFMAGKNLITSHSSIINYGIAGAKNFPIGEFFEINKISKDYSKNSYYPIKTHDFSLKSQELKTYQSVVTQYPENILVDMECFGFFYSALKFVSIEQIWVGKIISDNENQNYNQINKAQVIALINKNLAKLQEVISYYSDLAKQIEHNNINPQGYDLINQSVKFSFSEKVKLKKMLLNLQNDHKKIDFDLLISFGNSKKILEFLENDY